ncbi:efflux RND transporter permease subunit [Fulvivirga maritima]|uniref:efflux RND transporter permease subunit n=1 Tax=Fulvivirga maritima TaxID=2904247 RepID=UPI001F2CB13C|nr:efflux RND transporter permease subunit [Fulvivirga maritima]UII25597.1 efflux RND transporter permease subunit [Fulvivirga maritima]
MSISEIAIKRPLLIVVIFTVLLLFGLVTYFKLNYNLLPNIQVNTVSVTTTYPGASASEVESSVTKKLEDAFSSVEGLDKINSTSQEGVSQISVNLKSNADLDEAERNIQRKADQIANDLPEDADKPLISKVNLDETPVIKAGITSNRTPRSLYDLIDNEIKPVLQNLQGVGTVNIIGGSERQIQVNVSPSKLNAYHLNIDQVSQAITKANQSFPAGKIETDNRAVSIRYDANLTNVEQIRKLIVYRNNSSVIYLEDVAEVMDATADVTALNQINGLPSVGIQIIKQSDANAVNVSALVKEKFKDLEQEYEGDELAFSISSDQSTYTLASADAVIEDLGLAVVIVGIVMLAFLHSFRSSLFVMVALPCSIIPTFIAIYFFDFSLNLMTLMALSLVVGILVDDSIVVLENIYRHMEMGSKRMKAALDGRNEIGFTALAITLVDVVVFLPLALSGGIIGSILKEFSLVVVFSTLMSLFVSFTVTPMLASRFGKLEHLSKDNLWGRINLSFENFITDTKEAYGKSLAYILNKKRWLLSGVFLLIVASLFLVGKGFIGFAFIPESDQGELNINLELEPTASIYQTNSITQQAEKIILEQKEVEKVFSSIGFVSGSVAGTSNNSNMAELTVSLVDEGERDMSSQEFGLKMKQVLTQEIPGVKVTSSAVSISGGSSQIPIQIAVLGTNLENVRKTAEEIMAIVADVPGTQYVKLSVKDQKQEIEVNLNRDKMTLLGLDASQVGAALQNAFSGNKQNVLKDEGNEYDINISMEPQHRADISDVRNLSFTNNEGANFVLSEFAEVRYTLGESVLQRSNRMGSITVNSNVIGRPVGSVANDIKAKVKDLQLPAGISIDYLGDVKNQGDAFGSLGLALISAILLVYLIMVALYESVIYPFVVLFSIPVALIGALLALALTMETLNIFSIIGIIMLLGLVSKNAILIVDFTNQLKAEGKPLFEALVEAGKERLRPILMTTLAMILGMLPIAIASGAGAEIKNGMAWVIIGGLSSSMIFTLFVVPCMYFIVDKLKGRIQRSKASEE